MPGVNSTLFENIWEKILQQTLPVWKLCPLFVKSNKTKNPNCRTVTPNNYYTFSLAVPGKRSPGLYFSFFTEMLNFYQIMEEQDSSITMRPPQWADIRLCWQEVAKRSKYFLPNNIMKYFLKKLNDLSRVSIAGAGLCWQ